MPRKRQRQGCNEPGSPAVVEKERMGLKLIEPSKLQQFHENLPFTGTIPQGSERVLYRY